MYFFGSDERSEKNDICMTMLLASISNKFVIGDHIPKVEYRTLLDIYLDFCFYMQLLTLFVSVVVFWFSYIPPFANSLNFVIFSIEIGAAYLFHDWLHAKIMNNEIDIEHWLDLSKVPDDTQKTTAAPADAIKTSSSATTVGAAAGASDGDAQMQISNALNATIAEQRLADLMRRNKHKRRESCLVYLINFFTNPDRVPLWGAASPSLLSPPSTSSGWSGQLDDGSSTLAAQSHDHFLHFGAMQISPNVFSGIRSRLEDSYEKAKLNFSRVRCVCCRIVYRLYVHVCVNALTCMLPING